MVQALEGTALGQQHSTKSHTSLNSTSANEDFPVCFITT